LKNHRSIREPKRENREWGDQEFKRGYGDNANEKDATWKKGYTKERAG